MTLALIAAATRSHARSGSLTDARQAIAMAELAEVADGRVDLLAEHAGLAMSIDEDDLDAPICRRIAQLCIMAGADMALIDSWIEEGRRRRAQR